MSWSSLWCIPPGGIALVTLLCAELEPFRSEIHHTTHLDPCRVDSSASREGALSKDDLRFILRC